VAMGEVEVRATTSTANFKRLLSQHAFTRGFLSNYEKLSTSRRTALPYRAALLAKAFGVA
jgi:hypothetical protein